MHRFATISSMAGSLSVSTISPKILSWIISEQCNVVKSRLVKVSSVLCCVLKASSTISIVTFLIATPQTLILFVIVIIELSSSNSVARVSPDLSKQKFKSKHCSGFKPSTSIFCETLKISNNSVRVMLSFSFASKSIREQILPST